MNTNTHPVRALIAKWRRQAAEHGTRTFTGNDHAMFANELEAALASAPPAEAQAQGGGEAVAWLRMTPDGTPDWAEDCIGSDDKFLDPEMASDGYYLQPLYAAPQQPAAVDEAPTWSRQQPTVPGIYGIRGFNLCRPASEQFEAVVVVREHGGELVCNLHESTSEDDLESWAPICDLDPDFEWRVFVPGWQQQGGA